MDNNINIINGDCLEVLKRIPINYRESRVGCIWMDIPDNIGLDYRGENGKEYYIDKKEIGDYYNWIHLILLESLIRGKIVWICYNSIHDLELTWLIRDVIKYRHPSFEISKFIWTYTFSQYRENDCAQGFRPMIRLKRGDAKIYPGEIREVSKRMELGDARAAGPRVPSNVWEFPRVVGNSSERCNWIPTQIPIGLMERIVKLSIAPSFEGGTGPVDYSGSGTEWIIDLFGGSGSLIKAVKRINLGREVRKESGRYKGIVIEINGEYCEKMKEDLKGMKEGVKIIKFDHGFDWNSVIKG